MTASPAPGTAQNGPPPVRIGALVPLSPPGWVEAGRHLLAGLELAVRDVNGAGGIRTDRPGGADGSGPGVGRPLELVARDTAADPRRAEAAVEELSALGVTALTGEYHSVVARSAAARADALGLPYLCSSAVLDALTDGPADRVARLAPAQSHGWRIYGDFLLAAGHRRVAVASQDSVYWAAGTGVLRDHLAARGGTVVRLDAGALPPAAVCDALADDGATALLLLVGHPEPAVPLVRAVRRDRRLAGLLVGAPAGQPEFAGWAALLGDDGAAVPFLRYLPGRLGTLGTRVAADLRERLGEAPSFVAFEGYDSVAVLADVLRAHGTDRDTVARSWPSVDTEGTRGRIRFSRVPGIGVRQWAWPPVQVVDRDPAAPGRFRVLHTGGTDGAEEAGGAGGAEKAGGAGGRDGVE
ncbi:ABC transporter substrate-binding protein [Streptomyces sp. NPDC015492]|uniref:ABC transporter substrate-binding protein n=1 Tax=Streptomyces sp. NPDC015492 TaxID=3364958 RepID=UPI0036F8DCE9